MSLSLKAFREVKHPWMATLDLVTAVLLLGGIWLALPARWWPVDVFGTALGLLLGASGIGLLREAEWSPKVARIAAATSLTVGTLLVVGLAFTAGSISGLYGPVGAGGALLLIAVAALLLPYLVIFPAAQLYFLHQK